MTTLSSSGNKTPKRKTTNQTKKLTEATTVILAGQDLKVKLKNSSESESKDVDKTKIFFLGSQKQMKMYYIKTVSGESSKTGHWISYIRQG